MLVGAAPFPSRAIEPVERAAVGSGAGPDVVSTNGIVPGPAAPLTPTTGSRVALRFSALRIRRGDAGMTAGVDTL